MCIRQVAIFSLIIAAIWAVPPSATLNCSQQDQDGGCHIEGLTLDSNTVFPEQSVVHLDNCTVEVFSPELAANISSSTKDLSFENGFAPKVFIKPTLRSFTALRADTAEVQINPEDNFNLEKLDIEGHLQTLPDNVQRLRRLTVLNLCRNGIQEVDLDKFAGLHSLRKLNLGHNDIHSVRLTKDVNLPSLEELFLHGNDLTTLDLHHLQADNLKRLYLSQNHLVRIGGFPSSPGFGRLVRVDLYQNQWNCEWLESALGVLNTNGVETLSYLPERVCDERGSVKVDAIACE